MIQVSPQTRILVAVEGRGVDVDQWKYHIWSAQLILAVSVGAGLVDHHLGR